MQYYTVPPAAVAIGVSTPAPNVVVNAAPPPAVAPYGPPPPAYPPPPPFNPAAAAAYPPLPPAQPSAPAVAPPPSYVYPAAPAPLVLPPAAVAAGKGPGAAAVGKCDTASVHQNFFAIQSRLWKPDRQISICQRSSVVNRELDSAIIHRNADSGVYFQAGPWAERFGLE